MAGITPRQCTTVAPLSATLCLAALVPVLAIPLCAVWLTRGLRQSADSP